MAGVYRATKTAGLYPAVSSIDASSVLCAAWCTYCRHQFHSLIAGPAAFPPPLQDAAAALRSLDTEAFSSLDDVSTLLHCLPTADERSALEVGQQALPLVCCMSMLEKYIQQLYTL